MQLLHDSGTKFPEIGGDKAGYRELEHSRTMLSKAVASTEHFAPRILPEEPCTCSSHGHPNTQPNI